jgi:hypothetical protein
MERLPWNRPFLERRGPTGRRRLQASGDGTARRTERRSVAATLDQTTTCHSNSACRRELARESPTAAVERLQRRSLRQTERSRQAIGAAKSRGNGGVSGGRRPAHSVRLDKRGYMGCGPKIYDLGGIGLIFWRVLGLIEPIGIAANCLTDLRFSSIKKLQSRTRISHARTPSAHPLHPWCQLFSARSQFSWGSGIRCVNWRRSKETHAVHRPISRAGKPGRTINLADCEWSSSRIANC